MGFDYLIVTTHTDALSIFFVDEVPVGEPILQVNLRSDTDFLSLKRKAIVALIAYSLTPIAPTVRPIRALLVLI